MVFYNDQFIVTWDVMLIMTSWLNFKFQSHYVTIRRDVKTQCHDVEHISTYRISSSQRHLLLCTQWASSSSLRAVKLGCLATSSRRHRLSSSQVTYNFSPLCARKFNSFNSLVLTLLELSNYYGKQIKHLI